MSSSDRAVAPIGRIASVAAVLLALAAVAGCTVQPLYGNATSDIGGDGATSSRLAQVEVGPATDRVGQEVRNHLIFLLGGGKGQPDNPVYSLDLDTTSSRSRAATIETRSGAAFAPTSGIATVRGTYRLTDTRTGEVISAGTRAVQAPFDIPAQDFAALRAERNAEDRAAREMAELLRLVIAQELERPTSTTGRAIILSPEDVEDEGRPGDPASL